MKVAKKKKRVQNRLPLVNDQGLSRYIPADVRLEVRKRCGFGCVVCGLAIYQYDHMTTTFAEADTHDPDDITLLCGSCHQRKTSGMLSVPSVVRANQHPRCKTAGFSRGPLDLSDAANVQIGNIRTTTRDTILEVNGTRLLYFNAPEMPGAPLRLNALVTDKAGVPVLRIEDNEWQTPGSNWDVAVEGKSMTIRRGRRDVVLRLTAHPPERLVFDRLQMAYEGLAIDCRPSGPVHVIHGKGRVFTVDGAGISIEGSTCLSVTKEDGVRLGVGGGSVTVEDGGVWTIESQVTIG